MVSHKRLLALPEIENLRRLSQSLAMLDAIMSPDWEYRYYSRRLNAERSPEELVADLEEIGYPGGIT